MSPSTSDDIVPDFIQEDYIQMQQGIYLPWQLADLEVNQDATLLSFSTQKVTQKKTTTGRIHGTGIFTYMNGWFFMVNVGKHTVPYMDPMGNWVVATQRLFMFNPIWGR